MERNNRNRRFGEYITYSFVLNLCQQSDTSCLSTQTSERAPYPTPAEMRPGDVLCATLPSHDCIRFSVSW